MKSIFTFCIAILTGLPLWSSAQTQITEATLQYDISISGKGSEALAERFKNAKLTLYLKNGLSKAEMTSSLGKESNVYNNKTGKGFILKEYSGQKLMITMTKQNWDQKNRKNKAVEFTIGNDWVTIAGIKCKKATGTTEDGNTLLVYFDPTQQLTDRNYNNAFAQLPGLPVQYEMQSGNLTFSYTLNQINSNPVPTSIFDAPSSGYRVMSYEENQQLKIGEGK